MSQPQRARRPGLAGMCVILACACMSPGQARGQSGPRAEPADPAAGSEPSFAPGALPAAVAVVPGVLIHGSGHYLAGDRRTARRLLVLEGVALGTMAASGAVLGLSGASRRLTLPTIPLLIAGSGLFLTGWIADIYGAGGGPRLAGTPPRRLPGVDLRLGYLYVHDPQFAYGHFTEVAAHGRRGAWRAGAHAQLAADDDNQRVRATLERRFVGPRRLGRARDGTALDLTGALIYHRYGSDGFTSYTGELSVGGRYDLARLSPTLAGAFVDMGMGLGLEVTTYQVSNGADALDRLVAHFAVGMYLGTPGAVHGHVRVGYDHRRDDLAGGLATAVGSSGFLGSVGADSVIMFGPRWGVAASARAGSAYLGGASLIYRRE